MSKHVSAVRNVLRRRPKPVQKKSFMDGPFWRAGVPRVGGRAAVPFVHKLNPRVFCVFARNRNDNLAVFEGVVENGKLVGVEYYWINLDFGFMKKARKNGIRHDREEHNVFDNMGYGFKTKVLDPGRKIRVVMHRLPDRPMMLVLEGKEVNAYVQFVDGRWCKLSYIWIEDNGVLQAKVKYIDLFGLDARELKSKKRTQPPKQIQERIPYS